VRAFLIVGLIAGPAAPALAQQAPVTAPAPAAVARTMIEQMETFRDKETFRLVGEVRGFSFSNASEEEGYPFDFAIDPKKDYRLVAICDDYCDLDLVAENASGDEMGADRRGDFVAHVDVEPNKSGSKVRAKVFPGNCTRRGAESCVAGLALFEVLQRKRGNGQ
jgi:hypothetical protein